MLRRHPAVRRDRRRSTVRTGPVPDGRPELQTRHGPAAAGQQGHRQPLPGLHARLRPAVGQLLGLGVPRRRRRLRIRVGSGRRRRLLVRLRRRPRRMRAWLPRADGCGVDAPEMGLRILAVEGTLQDLRRTDRRGARIPPAAHSNRRHRAGLGVLGRQTPLERPRMGLGAFPEPQGRHRPPARRVRRAAVGLGVAGIRSRDGRIPRPRGRRSAVRRADMGRLQGLRRL